MNFGLTEFCPFHLCWNMCIHWKLFWMWKNIQLVFLLLHEMEIENVVCIDISFQEFIISIFMIHIPRIFKSWNAIMSEITFHMFVQLLPSYYPPNLKINITKWFENLCNIYKDGNTMSLLVDITTKTEVGRTFICRYLF